MKTVLFRIYLVLAILAVAGVRLASPVWIEDSPELRAQQEEAFLYDVETRLIYIAGGVSDETTLISYAYYDPMLIYDSAWQSALLHTVLTVEQADDYLKILDAPESQQEYYQAVLIVSDQCKTYGDHLLDAIFTYGYTEPDPFIASMDAASEAYLSCVEMFNNLSEEYNLFPEPIEGDSA